MPVWSNDDWLTCLKEKELIINMVLVAYSILATVLKWRPANGVVYTFAKMTGILVQLKWESLKNRKKG